MRPRARSISRRRGGFRVALAPGFASSILHVFAATLHSTSHSFTWPGTTYSTPMIPLALAVEGTMASSIFTRGFLLSCSVLSLTNSRLMASRHAGAHSSDHLPARSYATPGLKASLALALASISLFSLTRSLTHMYDNLLLDVLLVLESLEGGREAQVHVTCSMLHVVTSIMETSLGNIKSACICSVLSCRTVSYIMPTRHATCRWGS